jgi:hypothetical protein
MVACSSYLGAEYGSIKTATFSDKLKTIPEQGQTACLLEETYLSVWMHQ